MIQMQAVFGREEMLAAMEKLLTQAKNGEVGAIAARVYKADGTWEDVVAGDTEEERADALGALRAAYDKAN
jgi:hypothetical protein